MSRIVIEKLEPRYFTAPAASAIWGQSCELSPGIHLIVARSGRGKSSLLKYLSSYEKSCTGKVQFKKDKGENSFRFDCAYMEQQLRSIKGFQVLETLSIGLPGQTMTDSNTITALLNELGIGHITTRSCDTISRGELQRLMFARALLQDAAWLVLDEPWAHVDTEQAQIMAGLLEKAVLQGRGVVCSTLDAQESTLFSSSTLWSLDS